MAIALGKQDLPERPGAEWKSEEPRTGRPVFLNQWRWVTAIVATLAVILIVNPVGFVGGGWDDWHYLDSARCWVENGPCLPHNHWQGRWPLIAPLAAAIAIFGESRLSVGLPILAYSLGCLVLLAWLGNRLAAKPVGYLAALFLLVTPAFAVQLLDPTVEAGELFFLFAAACCAARFAETRSSWLAVAAGFSLSLAFQVRETAIVAVPIAAVVGWLLARSNGRFWIAAIAGFALPLAVEAVTFWVATGDPLWRRSLSAAHTQIPSSELAGPIDRSRPPFFNPAYIANWRQEPGIHLHWLLDGLVNLFVNLKAGATLALSALLFAISRGLDPKDRSLVQWCLGLALYWACFLIYVLAIDPKARMMLAPVVLTAIALAVLLRDRAAKGSGLLAWSVGGIVWLLGLAVTLTHPQARTSQATAERWASRFPGQIETNETGRRHLALTNAGKEFAPLDSDRPMLALRLSVRCSEWAEDQMNGALVVVDRSSMGLIDPPHVRQINNFCLFRYVRPVAPSALAAAI